MRPDVVRQAERGTKARGAIEGEHGRALRNPGGLVRAIHPIRDRPDALLARQSAWGDCALALSRRAISSHPIHIGSGHPIHYPWRKEVWGCLSCGRTR